MKEREINKASGITPVGVVTAILTFNMCRHDKYTLLSYQWLSLTFFVVNSWNGFVILFHSLDQMVALFWGCFVGHHLEVYNICVVHACITL